MSGRHGAKERDTQVGDGPLGKVDRNLVCSAVFPVAFHDGVRGRNAAVGQVGWDIDFHAIFLRVEIVFWVTTADKNTTVRKKSGLAVIQARHDCLTKDRETLVARLRRIIKNGLKVGRVGKTKACDAILRSTHDEVCTVWQRSHYRHHTLTARHSLDDPFTGAFWLDGDTVVEGETKGTSSASENLERRGVWWVLRERDRRAFHRIGTASALYTDGAWGNRERLRSGKRNLVENSAFVVIDDKDSSGWQDIDEWIKVVRVGTEKPIHRQQSRSALRFGQDLEGRAGLAVGAFFATDNEDGAIGHYESRGIPSLILEMNEVKLFNPVGRSIDTRRTAGSIQSNALGAVQ